MNYIKDSNGVWTVISDTVHTFDKDHPNYAALIAAIKDKDNVAFEKAISVGRTIQEWSYDSFLFEDGVLRYQGEEIDTAITSIITDMIAEGFDHLPMLRFLERLFKNPSFTAIHELYTWLANKSLAITPDGCFLAFKYVALYDGDDTIDAVGRPLKRGDYVDCFHKTNNGKRFKAKPYRNNVEDVNTMPRYKVNDDRTEGCSTGFHVGTKDYVSGNGDIVIICKVDPADVVSIPSDCSCQKLRCCEYEVISVERTMKLVEDPANWGHRDDHEEYDDEFDDDDDDEIDSDLDDDDDDDVESHWDRS
jgi:hypothetical protein